MDTTATLTDTSVKSPTSRERVAADLRALVGDAQSLLEDTVRVDDQQLARLRQRMRDEVARLRLQLGELEAVAETKVRAAARQTDQAVHSHPYAAMGMAATVGVLLGFVLGRR